MDVEKEILENQRAILRFDVRLFSYLEEFLDVRLNEELYIELVDRLIATEKLLEEYDEQRNPV